MGPEEWNPDPLRTAPWPISCRTVAGSFEASPEVSRAALKLRPVDYSSASDSDPESSETEGVDPETLESEDAGFEDPRSDSKIYRL